MCGDEPDQAFDADDDDQQVVIHGFAPFPVHVIPQRRHYAHEVAPWTVQQPLEACINPQWERGYDLHLDARH
ncbi:hypothetical protein MmonteBS_31340 [Mycobacterium montefiorense]|uniref:Uncharacterized protein n=1 Tax=Mycobacterium montefiorense TaxID=154654 RepID=A0ABQ0NRK5_9MYCO|nr:hypothetical protein MmonteBS_31340 [Mycobacterium montefiorense]